MCCYIVFYCFLLRSIVFYCILSFTDIFNYNLSEKEINKIRSNYFDTVLHKIVKIGIII